MNTLRYEGTLYKKYAADDVISAIKEYALINGLRVKTEGQRIVPVFPFWNEGFHFSFEGKSLLSVTVKYEMPKDASQMLIYEILFHIKKYFSKFYVYDEYGIWANLLYEKYPTHIPLRELDENEQGLLTYINYEGCTDSFQVLYGIIYLYIGHLESHNLHEKAVYKPLNWFALTEKSLFSAYLPVWVQGVIETWIYTSMEYKNKGSVQEILGPIDPAPFAAQLYETSLKKRVSSDLCELSWGISTAVIDFYGGTTGKKMVDILRFFENQEAIFGNQSGKSIRKDPELMLRFVLSCLNFFGYYIVAKPMIPDEKLLVKNISYFDMF